MEHTLPNRIHPMLAVAAFSLTLVSLVGAASILGLLPNSRAQGNAQPEMTAAAMQPQVVQQQIQPQPQVVEQRVVHHRAPVRTVYRDEPAPVRSVPAPAPAPQNSVVGMGLGAVVGGLLGNQVGGGKGRTLATIAGAVGGAYAGNEIAKRNP